MVDQDSLNEVTFMEIAKIDTVLAQACVLSNLSICESACDGCSDNLFVSKVETFI